MTVTYFIGIGGIGMSALARILLQKGEKVSGSDIRRSSVTEELEHLGAEIFYEQCSSNIIPGMEVVYSTAIKKGHQELEAAKTKECVLIHRSELLQKLMSYSKKTLAVSGTHGKTTTSALITHILISAKRDPSYVIGGVLQGIGSNGAWGKGSHLVIEADESDGSLTCYHPDAAIITNIEADHLEHHGTFENLQQSFKQFLQQVKNQHMIVWCGDDQHLSKMSIKGISYGFSEGVDAKVSHFFQDGWTSHFDLTFQEKRYSNIQLALIGRHNVLNASAVFVLALQLGLSEEIIREAFTHFLGVKSRCEEIGSIENTCFFHDYAHHPTEVKATLQSLRDVFPEKRILTIFQPHRYNRTKNCKGMFQGIFDGVNRAIVTDIFSAGEAIISGIHATDIIQEVKERDVEYVSKDLLENWLERNYSEYDVVISLGAGDIGSVLSKFHKKHLVDYAQECP